MSEKKTEESGEEQKKGGKLKLIIVAVLVLALGGGAGWWFFLKPSGEKKEAKPEPGEVLVIEPIQINLADGHYLKFGMALQATADATGHGELDGSKALDAAIDLFSGQDKEHLGQKKERAKLKKELMHELKHDYHGDVMDVYFTDFVTQ